MAGQISSKQNLILSYGGGLFCPDQIRVQKKTHQRKGPKRGLALRSIETLRNNQVGKQVPRLLIQRVEHLDCINGKAVRISFAQTAKRNISRFLFLML